MRYCGKNDEVQMAIGEGGGYINYLSSTSSDYPAREVKIGAIISAVRRLRKENYTIYIISEDSLNIGGSDFADIKNSILKSNPLKYKYVDNNEYTTSKYIQISMLNRDVVFYNKVENDGVERYVQGINNDLLTYLNKVIGDDTYYEFIGIYQDQKSEDVSSVNSTTNKIITFVKKK